MPFSSDTGHTEMVITSGKKGESDYELQHSPFLDERPYLDETSRKVELYIVNVASEMKYCIVTLKIL